MTRNTGAAFFWTFDFQASADQLSPVLHDMKTQAMLQFRFLRKSDASIDYAHSHSLRRSFQFDNDFPRLGMLVGIDDRFARDLIELRFVVVIVDVYRRLHFHTPRDFP